jgi:hypothetical protein
MNYNKVITSTPEKVRDVMMVLQQLIIRWHFNNFSLILYLGPTMWTFQFLPLLFHHYLIPLKRGKGEMMIIIITITITTTIITTITIIVTIIIILFKGKEKWRIVLQIHPLSKHELEDWGHYWVIQQNVNENTSNFPEVLYRRYN